MIQVTRYENDPLNYHHALKAQWGVEYLRAIETGKQGIEAVKLPALLIHGTDDGIVPIKASEFIYDNIASSDKTFEVSQYK